MARFIYDQSEAEATFEPVPAGLYVARVDTTPIEERGVQTGQAKGTPYVTVYFLIEEPPEYAGRRLPQNYMVAGRGAFRLRQLLEAVGVLDQLQPTEAEGKVIVDSATFHGKRVRVRVGLRRDDPTRNEVTAVMPAQLPSEPQANNKPRISF